MGCLTPHPSLLFFLIFSLSLFLLSSTTAKTSHFHSLHGVEVVGEIGYDEVLPWRTRRSMAEDAAAANTSMILAQKRTNRKDPLDHFNHYTGVWFVIFGLSLSIICLCYCCCPREPYGYSRVAYALSLIFLILFTLAAIAGCIVLYTAQGKFHGSTSNTLKYVVSQADFTAENLRNVSDYLDAAKKIGVDAVFLPTDVQQNIDDVKTKINSAAVELSTKTEDNSEKIKDGIDGIRKWIHGEIYENVNGKALHY
ncbi:hypothetical protein SESBI_03821 [Sesbania bispinosa]|nr:hypothetical protein SESBI_03821 [Sesbania bispinosa]